MGEINLQRWRHRPHPKGPVSEYARRRPRSTRYREGSTEAPLITGTTYLGVHGRGCTGLCWVNPGEPGRCTACGEEITGPNLWQRFREHGHKKPLIAGGGVGL